MTTGLSFSGDLCANQYGDLSKMEVRDSPFFFFFFLGKDAPFINQPLPLLSWRFGEFRLDGTTAVSLKVVVFCSPIFHLRILVRGLNF